MQIVGLVISWAVAIGIILIGIGYAAKLERNATGFELPQLPEREARGWWQVKGVRDIVSGVLVIVAIITARADLVVDPSPLTHTARRRPRCPNKRGQEERSFRNSWSNRGRHDNRCVAA
jgi:hypothetical protein